MPFVLGFPDRLPLEDKDCDFISVGVIHKSLELPEIGSRAIPVKYTNCLETWYKYGEQRGAGRQDGVLDVFK